MICQLIVFNRSQNEVNIGSTSIVLLLQYTNEQQFMHWQTVSYIFDQNLKNKDLNYF